MRVSQGSIAKAKYQDTDVVGFRRSHRFEPTAAESLFGGTLTSLALPAPTLWLHAALILDRTSQVWVAPRLTMCSRFLGTLELVRDRKKQGENLGVVSVIKVPVGIFIILWICSDILRHQSVTHRISDNLSDKNPEVL